jgi:hypothetical protein
VRPTWSALTKTQDLSSALPRYEQCHGSQGLQLLGLDRKPTTFGYIGLEVLLLINRYFTEALL